MIPIGAMVLTYGKPERGTRNAKPEKKDSNKTGEKMDKDRFRQDLGGVMEAYAEVLERVKSATSTS